MRCAVIGSPVAHSLSPVMHRAAYDALGLDWTYEAIEVVEDALPDFVGGLDGSWHGISLTMPLKRAVLPLLDSLDDQAERTGAANTVLLTEERRLGFNTDVPGAVAAMAERLPDPVRSAVVLGGGATAASVLLALADRGCTSAHLVVREPGRAALTAEVVGTATELSLTVVPFDELSLPAADMVVSTVPAAAQTPQVVAACATIPAVFEVVYDPWPTPLAQAALDSGRPLVEGLDLLAQQAVRQLQVMTGRSVAVDLVRDAARAELERRAVEKPA